MGTEQPPEEAGIKLLIITMNDDDIILLMTFDHFIHSALLWSGAILTLFPD